MQTDYNLMPNRALPGLIANIAPAIIDSFACEGGIQAGELVIRGTDPQNQVKAARTAGDGAKAIGVACYALKVAETPDYYKETDAVAVMRKGKIHVSVTKDVVAGTPAMLIIDSGVAKFTDTGGEALTHINAIFETNTENGTAIISVG